MSLTVADGAVVEINSRSKRSYCINCEHFIMYIYRYYVLTEKNKIILNFYFVHSFLAVQIQTTHYTHPFVLFVVDQLSVFVIYHTMNALV